MNGSGGTVSWERDRVLNAVRLQNAVLCAECDVVSDSPNDVCMVCGSHSLFNIARLLGGKLPKERASLVQEVSNMPSCESVLLAFPKPHRPRRRATAVPVSSQAVLKARAEAPRDSPDQGKDMQPAKDRTLA